MKNINPQPTARQNSCRNETSSAIAPHGGVDNDGFSWQPELHFESGFSLREVAHKKIPTVTAVGIFLLRQFAFYFNKPPLCSGDDASTKPAFVKKPTFLYAR
jgi:hypothetical protein